MVRVGRSTCNTGWQTNVELDGFVLRVRLEPISPRLEGELRVAGLGCELFVSGPGRALRSVVELGEDHVKGCLGNGIGEACVRDDALRSCGDEKARVLGLQAVYEVAVVGGDGSWARDLAGISLEIEVETINIGIAERTRSGPERVHGSECTDKELSKPIGSVGVG